jgi:hypothetical protein
MKYHNKAQKRTNIKPIIRRWIRAFGRNENFASSVGANKRRIPRKKNKMAIFMITIL